MVVLNCVICMLCVIFYVEFEMGEMYFGSVFDSIMVEMVDI